MKSDNSESDTLIRCKWGYGRIECCHCSRDSHLQLNEGRFTNKWGKVAVLKRAMSRGSEAGKRLPTNGTLLTLKVQGIK